MKWMSHANGYVRFFYFEGILSSHFVFLEEPRFGLPRSFSNATNVYVGSSANVMYADAHVDDLSNATWIGCHELWMPMLVWVKPEQKLTRAFPNDLIKRVDFPHFYPFLETTGSVFPGYLVADFFFSSSLDAGASYISS